MKTSPLGRGRAITEVIIMGRDEGSSRSQRRRREDGRKVKELHVGEADR